MYSRFYANFIKLLIFIFLFLQTNSFLLAIDLKSVFDDLNSRRYEHWNTEKEKVTGYTDIQYIEKQKGNRNYLVEITENSHNNGEVFSRKELWLEKKTGKVLRYEEKELRTKIQTISEYGNKKITTMVSEEGNQIEFSIEIDNDLVPFETLPAYLQKSIPKILRKDAIKFELYLPALAIELEDKGLPASLSRFNMKATIKKKQRSKTALGRIETVEIELKPTSFFVKAILPKDKSKFTFVFARSAPHQLISFREADTISRLIRWGN